MHRDELKPFHVSRSSDGIHEWFSARDAATGVSIPCECKDNAISLVTSLNVAFSHHLSAALSEQTLPVRVEAVAWAYEFHDFGEVWARHVILNRPDGGANPPTKHHGSPVRNVRPLFSHPPRTALVDSSHASEAVVEKLREALEAARAWIDIVRGSCGSVEMPSWDNRDPSQIERETFALIDAALSASLRPAEVGSATETKGQADE